MVGPLYWPQTVTSVSGSKDQGGIYHLSTSEQQVTKPDLIIKLEVEEPEPEDGEISVWSFPGSILMQPSILFFL